MRCSSFHKHIFVFTVVSRQGGAVSVIFPTFEGDKVGGHPIIYLQLDKVETKMLGLGFVD